MTSMERALKTLGSQLQFKMVVAMIDVSAAVERVRIARSGTELARSRCDRSADELREVTHRPVTNLALINVVREMHERDVVTCALWDSRLQATQESEGEVRTVLTALRNQDETVRRGLKGELAKLRWKRAVLDASIVDELWLQRAARLKR